MPTKTWVVGEEVLAADFNAMVQDQVVATFPNAAARDADLTAPTEGQHAYLTDNNSEAVWNGSVWVSINNFRMSGGFATALTDSGAAYVITVPALMVNPLSVTANPAQDGPAYIIEVLPAYIVPGSPQIVLRIFHPDGTPWAGAVFNIYWMLLDRLS